MRKKDKEEITFEEQPKEITREIFISFLAGGVASSRKKKYNIRSYLCISPLDHISNLNHHF